GPASAAQPVGRAPSAPEPPRQEIVLAALNVNFMQIMRWVYVGVLLGAMLGLLSAARGRSQFYYEPPYQPTGGGYGYYSADYERASRAATNSLIWASLVWGFMGGICGALTSYYKQKSAVPRQEVHTPPLVGWFVIGALVGSVAMGIGGAGIAYAINGFFAAFVGLSLCGAVAGFLIGLPVTGRF